MNQKTNAINYPDIQMKYRPKGFYQALNSPKNKSSLISHQKQYSDYQVISPNQNKNEKILHHSIKRNYDPEGNAIITTKIVREIDYDNNKNSFDSNSIMNIRPKAINSSFQRNNEQKNEILRYSNYSNNEEMDNASAIYSNRNYGYSAVSPNIYESYENNYTKINTYGGSGIESDGNQHFYQEYRSPGSKRIINLKRSEISPGMPNYTSGSDFDEAHTHSKQSKYINNTRQNLNYSQRVGLNKVKYNRYNLESPYTQNDDFDSPDRNYDYNSPYFRNIQIEKIKGIQPIYQEKMNMMNNQIETSGEYERRGNYFSSRDDDVYDIVNEKAIQLQSNVRGFLVRKKVLRYITLALYYQSFCDKIQDALVFHVRKEVFNILKNIIKSKNKYGRRVNNNYESSINNSKRKNKITTRTERFETEINTNNKYKSLRDTIKSRNLNDNKNDKINREKIIERKEYREIHNDISPKSIKRDYSENLVFNKMRRPNKTDKYNCKKDNINYSINYSNTEFRKFDYTESPTKKVQHYFIRSPCSNNKPHNRFYKEIDGKSSNIYRNNLSTYRSYRNMNDTKHFRNYDRYCHYKYKYENNTSTMFQDKPEYKSGIGTRSYSRGIKTTYSSSNQNIDRCHCLDGLRKNKEINENINVNIYRQNDYNIRKEYETNDIRKEVYTEKIIHRTDERDYNRFNNDQIESDNYISLNIVKLPQKRETSTDQKEEIYTKTVETKEYVEDKKKEPEKKRFSKIEVNQAENVKIMPIVQKSKSTREIFTNTTKEPNTVMKMETINLAGKEIDKEKERKEKERVEIEIERRIKERVEIEKREIERQENERKRDRLEQEKKDKEKRDQEEQMLIEREKKIRIEQEKIDKEWKEIERREKEAERKREKDEKDRKNWEEKIRIERIEKEKRIEEERREKERERERERKEKEKKEEDLLKRIREEQLRIERERKKKEEQDRIERERREKERKDKEEKLKVEREERLRREKEERERIERERKKKAEDEKRERERKEKERKEELITIRIKEEQMRIERERKRKEEQDKKDRERKELEEKRRKEKEEKERIQRIEIERTKIIEKDRVTRLQEYEKDRKERLEKRLQDKQYNNLGSHTITKTTKKVTTTEYSNKNEGGQTRVTTTSYYKPGGGKYPYGPAPGDEYILKKDCQKNLNAMKLKLEQEYEKRIEMEKKRGEEELRRNQENIEKRNKIEIEKLIEIHKREDNERLREIEKEREILRKKELELEKLREKEQRMGIQIETDKQRELQRLKEIEEKNRKNKLVRVNKEIEINLKNTESLDRKQYTTTIKRDREKDIIRAKEIIRIFILSRCDPLMKKRKYFNVWRRKARLLQLEENSKIIQEFCRNNLEMSKIKNAIRMWRNLSKKIYYKTRVRILKMRPRGSKINIKMKKLYELIRITKLNTIFSRRRFIHFIILIWHIYAKNIHKKRSNMKYLYENLLKTYMSLANDIFGNNQFENPSVQDAMYEAVNTNKFITLYPDDVPLARKHYEEMRKMKSADSKDRGIYYQGSKIIKSATTTKLEVEKNEVKSKYYNMGKINENKDENNSESDDTEKKKNERKQRKLNFLEKYRKNKFYNDLEKKQNNTYVGYGSNNNNYSSLDKKNDKNENIIDSNNSKNSSYLFKKYNKDSINSNKSKDINKQEDNKYSYKNYTKTEGNTSSNYSKEINVDELLKKYGITNTNNNNKTEKKDEKKIYSYSIDKNKNDSKNTDNNVNIIYSSNIKQVSSYTSSIPKIDTSKYENKNISTISSQKSSQNTNNIYKPQAYDTYQKKVYVKTTTEEPKTYSKKIEIKTTTTSALGNLKTNNYNSNKDDSSSYNSYIINNKADNKKGNELHKSNTESKMNFSYSNQKSATGGKITNIKESGNSGNTYGKYVQTKIEKKVVEEKPYKSTAGKSQDSKNVVITRQYKSNRYNK